MDFDADTSPRFKLLFLARVSETAPYLMELTLSQLMTFFSFVSLFKAPDINIAALFNAVLLVTKPRFLHVDLFKPRFLKTNTLCFLFLLLGLFSITTPYFVIGTLYHPSRCRFIVALSTFTQVCFLLLVLYSNSTRENQ